MDMLISWIGIVISLWLLMSKHDVLYLQYMQRLFVNYTLQLFF